MAHANHKRSTEIIVTQCWETLSQQRRQIVNSMRRVCNYTVVVLSEGFWYNTFLLIWYNYVSKGIINIRFAVNVINAYTEHICNYGLKGQFCSSTQITLNMFLRFSFAMIQSQTRGKTSDQLLPGWVMTTKSGIHMASETLQYRIFCLMMTTSDFFINRLEK